MGYADDLAAGALRCTTGRSTSAEDVDTAASVIATALARIRVGAVAASAASGS
jgi:cysteine sulfinate desulfinase/cysteine desulfurase-like protein